MKIFQIKVSKKKSDKPTWQRIIVPSGITFSALGVIIDDIMQVDSDEKFVFSFYLSAEVFEADEETPLKSRMWRYDAMEASGTFIDDLFEPAKSFSYSAQSFSFKIDIEKEYDTIAIDYPYVIKSSYVSDIDGINNKLSERYLLKNGKVPFIRKSEIKKGLAVSSLFPYSTRPISSEENASRSTASLLMASASLIGDYIEKKQKTIKPEYGKMSFSKLIERRPVTEIKDFAKALRISRYSVMTKPELCDAVAAELLDPEIMIGVLLPVSDVLMNSFELLLANDCVLKLSNEEELIGFLCLSDFYYVDVIDGYAVTSHEVKEAFEMIADDFFFTEQKKIQWVENIVNKVIPNYYGIIPIDLFCRLCSRKRDPEIKPKEVMEIYKTIPDVFNSCVIIDGNIADGSCTDRETYKAIKGAHGSKPFDLVPVGELETLFRYNYPARDPSYVRLRSFLRREFDCSDKDADDILFDLHDMIPFEKDYDELLKVFEDFEIKISFEKLEKLIPILNDVVNNTRTYHNCGFTPTAMMKNFDSRGLSKRPSVIIPMSSQAAAMLSKSKNEFEMMGIKIDLDSATQQQGKKKKIYPNDPCPCGSGKKYKKCCRDKKQ